MHLQLIVFVVSFGSGCFAAKFEKKKLGEVCTTPDGKNGTCVLFDTCEKVFNAAASKNKTILSTVVFKSLCNNDVDPVVCCESPGPTIKPNFDNIPDKSECGLVKETPRIIGGEVTQLGEFPWMVAIEYKLKESGAIVGIKCGATLINKRYVMAAARCLNHREFEIINVRLGEWKLSTDPDCKELVANIECNDPVKVIKIKQAIPHPFYSRKSGANDIGIIVLEEDVVYTDYIRPICLPTLSLPPLEFGNRLTTIGWGVTENGTTSDVLLKVDVPLLANSVCQEKFGGEVVLSKALCAGGEEGKDSCQGDAGPLMRTYHDPITKQQQWYQEGVSSLGVGCGRVGYPGIYTSVSSHLSWILKVISED